MIAKKYGFSIVFMWTTVILLGLVSYCVAGPKIEFKELEYDFGELKQGEIATHIFEFQNIGDEKLTIENVKASWGCTATNLSVRDLDPKQNGKIKTSFNTKGRSGKQLKTIYVNSNDKENAVVKLTMQVFIKVDLTLIPQSLNFGNVSLGQEVMKRVSIKNTSGKTMVINSMQSGNEKFTSIDILNREKKWPLTLQSDEQMQILVGLKYKEDKPRIRDSISIKYNAGSENETELVVYAMKESSKPQNDQIQKSQPPPPNLPKKLKKEILPKDENTNKE